MTDVGSLVQSLYARAACHARAGVARGPDGGLARRGAHDVAAAERLGGDAGGGGPPDAAHLSKCVDAVVGVAVATVVVVAGL